MGSRFLSDPSFALEQITVDVVLNFPESVNAKRSPHKFIVLMKLMTSFVSAPAASNLN